MRVHQDMVFSTAARLLGDDAQAEDVAQDAFVKAFEHFEQLRVSPTAGGWLRTVARHQALNHLTRYRRRWRLFSELSTPEEDIPRPDSSSRGSALTHTVIADLHAEQQRGLIEQALQKLPAAQRVPLVLYHFEELSYEQIAAQLRISLAKVKTDIHRGRAALLAVLESRGLAEELKRDLAGDELADAQVGQLGSDP